MKKLTTLALIAGIALTGCSDGVNPELQNAHDTCGSPAFVRLDGDTALVPIRNGSEGPDATACVARELGMNADHLTDVIEAYKTGHNPFGPMGEGRTANGHRALYTYTDSDYGHAILIEVVE